MRSTEQRKRAECESLQPGLGLVAAPDGASGPRPPILADGRPLSVDPAAGVANLVKIAARQSDLVSTAQLIAAGITPSAIRSLVERGLLIPVRRGVYRLGSGRPGELDRELAALLAAGPGSFLVGHSALVVWRVLPADGHRAVEISGPGRLHHKQGVCARRLRTLAAGDVRSYRGVLVTSCERALYDSIGRLDPATLLDAADEAVVNRATSRAKLRALAERFDGRTGGAEMRRLAGDVRGADVSRSEAQRLALRLIRSAGLPEPDTEVSLCGYRADFHFAAAGVVFEVDGFGPHGQKRSNFVRDRRKDAAFRAAGLLAVRVAAGDLRERPFAVTADLAAEIRAGLLRRGRI